MCECQFPISIRRLYDMGMWDIRLYHSFCAQTTIPIPLVVYNYINVMLTTIMNNNIIEVIWKMKMAPNGNGTLQFCCCCCCCCFFAISWHLHFFAKPSTIINYTSIRLNLAMHPIYLSRLLVCSLLSMFLILLLLLTLWLEYSHYTHLHSNIFIHI